MDAVRLGDMTTTATNSSETLQDAAPAKICGTCGAENSAEAPRCATCRSDRFAPPWVLALRKLDRYLSVQVNKPHEKNEGGAPSLTFYRWWPGGRANIHIHEQAQWERAKEVVDGELLSALGWGSKKDLSKALESGGDDAKLREMVAKNPGLVSEMIQALEATVGGEQEREKLQEARDRVAAGAARLDSRYRAATKQAFTDLSDNDATAVKKLADLSAERGVEESSIRSAEMGRRLALLDLLEERMKDERSYKVLNHRSSVHQLVEQMMWLVDERCWLSGEGASLRRSLDAAAAERDKPYVRKPLDFACGVAGATLMVVSVQPPGRELVVEDLDGLEQHVAECRESKSFEAFKATLVGESISEELVKAIATRDASYGVETYEGLLAASRGAYRPQLAGASESS